MSLSVVSIRQRARRGVALGFPLAVAGSREDQVERRDLSTGVRVGDVGAVTREGLSREGERRTTHDSRRICRRLQRRS